jgi:hypothetical protein
MEARPTLNIISKIFAFVTHRFDDLLTPRHDIWKGRVAVPALGAPKNKFASNFHSSAKNILGRVTFRAAETTWHVGPHLGEMTFRGFVQPKYVGSLPCSVNSRLYAK